MIRKRSSDAVPGEWGASSLGILRVARRGKKKKDNIGSVTEINLKISVYKRWTLYIRLLVEAKIHRESGCIAPGSRSSKLIRQYLKPRHQENR